MSLLDDIKEGARNAAATVMGVALIDGFVIDCLVSDDHSFESEVSEYPVESGATITDHVRKRPNVITMECIVSNSPLPPVSEYRSVANGSDVVGAPSDEAYDHLMRIRDTAKRVTIRTSLRTYENMVLKSLSVPRSAATGSALRFTATFQQVQIVSAERNVRAAIPAARKPRTVHKPLTPVATGTKGSFTESLPLVKVFRRDGDFLWFDDDIAGWRYSAVHDAPIGGNTAEEGWVVFKGRPYGVSHAAWNTQRKSDNEYRADITAAYEARSELGGGGGGLALNPYDPFLDMGLESNASGRDVQIVHAFKR